MIFLQYSEAIIEEEDQAFTAERDIEEIDEQMWVKFTYVLVWRLPFLHDIVWSFLSIKK